jgi:hypothetical protein
MPTRTEIKKKTWSKEAVFKIFKKQLQATEQAGKQERTFFFLRIAYIRDLRAAVSD